MDVSWWCGYFCFGYQFAEWHLNAHAYYYGPIWGEWNNSRDSPWLYNYKFCWTNLVCCTEFVKDEGTNFFIMAIALHSIINCEILKILRVYGSTWFGHVTSKACQYATNDEKKFVVLRNVNVKETQNGLQKTITWTKKLGKGRQEWEQAYF